MRRTSPVRAMAVGVGLSALLLAGCGGDDDPVVEDSPSVSDDTPTTDEAPDDSAVTTAPGDDTGATSGGPDGVEATSGPADDAGATSQAPGDGEPVDAADGAFSVTPPAGWVDVTSEVEQEVELALRDEVRTDEFFTNLVVASEDPIGDLQDSIEAAAEQVAGADGEYELVDPIEIDGEEAYGFVLSRTTSGVEVVQTQWWVEHADRLYVATFSSASSQQEATQPVMEQLLDSWSWAD